MLNSPYMMSIALIFIMMNMMFVIGMLRRDNSMIDVFWGLGFVIITWTLHFLFPEKRGFFLDFLVTFWGLRLALYLGIRLREKGEDWRYAEWKRQWGRSFFIRSYLQVYMLQGFFMFIIALPLMRINSSVPSFSNLQILAICITFFGIIYETVADCQMRKFKSKPWNKGKVIQKGLWKYSRHPNYFGEICVWWGIFFYVYPYGNPIIDIISPMVLTVLILKVSGVPMLEKKYADNPDYQAYKQKTNALIPMKPK